MSQTLSGILGVNVNTYENPDLDAMVESMEQDLIDCSKDDMIEVQGVGKVKTVDIDLDDGLDWDGYKKGVGECMEYALEDVCDLKEIFMRYGLEYSGMSFYTPNAYNYGGDSLDIHLKIMREEYDLEAMGLKELIEQYIEEVRQPSCDGYCSFEPTDFEEVRIDDFCTLWAILKKEGVFDDLKEALECWVEDGFRDLVYEHCDSKYIVKIPNGKTGIRNGEEWNDWDLKEFNLDYDNSILIPYKNYGQLD